MNIYLPTEIQDHIHRFLCHPIAEEFKKTCFYSQEHGMIYLDHQMDYDDDEIPSSSYKKIWAEYQLYYLEIFIPDEDLDSEENNETDEEEEECDACGGFWSTHGNDTCQCWCIRCQHWLKNCQYSCLELYYNNE